MIDVTIREGFVVKVDLDTLTPGIKARLLLHGLKQKVADAGASKESDADKRAAGQKVLDSLYRGEWGVERAVAGVGVARTIILRSAKKAGKKVDAGAVKALATVDAAATFADRTFGKGKGDALRAKVAEHLAKRADTL